MQEEDLFRSSRTKDRICVVACKAADRDRTMWKSGLAVVLVVAKRKGGATLPPARAVDVV